MEESSENSSFYARGNEVSKSVLDHDMLMVTGEGIIDIDQKSNNNKAVTIVNHQQDHFLFNMSDETAIEILQYFDAKDLKKVALVSKKWASLSNDPSIWKGLYNQYTKGFLWQFLFKNPEMSSYIQYFNDVFNYNYDDLQRLLTSLAPKFISECRVTCKKWRKVREDYFKDMQISSINAQLTSILELVNVVPKETRGICANNIQRKSDFSIKDYHHLLPVLIKIAELDSLLTDLMYISRFCYSKKRDLNWFMEKCNVMLTAEAIVAINAYASGVIIKTIFERPELFHLRNKFTRSSLIQCIYIDDDTSLTILKDRTVINLLTDDDLVLFLKEELAVRKNFYQLLEQNPSLFGRMNNDFLIKLANEEEPYSSLILTHPKLLPLLTDEGVIKVSSKSGLRFKNDLENETFASFLEKKSQSFLIEMPDLHELIKNDRIAKYLDPQAVFKKALDVSLRIGLAVAEQNIILKQLSLDQLRVLAFEHPEIALFLLKNQGLKDRWDIRILDEILNKTKNYYNSAAIYELIQPLKQYIDQKQKAYSQPVPLPPKHYKNISTIYLNRSYYYPKYHPHWQKHTPSVSKNASVKTLQNSPFLPYSSLLRIGLILLALTSTFLLFTGIGGLLNIPLWIGLLTFVNACHISIETLALGSLILGACTGAPSIIGSLYLTCSSIKNFFNPSPKEPIADSKTKSTYSHLMKKSGMRNATVQSDIQVSTSNHRIYNFIFNSCNKKSTHTKEPSLPQKEIQTRAWRSYSV